MRTLLARRRTGLHGRVLVPAAGLLAGLAACSSGGSRPAAVAVPSPTPATATPTTAAGVTSPAPTPTPRTALARTAAPTPTPTPTARRTTSRSPLATARTASPTPAPAPRRTGTTLGVAEVTGDRFSPSSLTLHVGDTVLVTDQDPSVPHTFTIEALHVDSGGMSDGQTFRYRAVRPGRFTFVCSYHQGLGMTGTLTVLS